MIRVLFLPCLFFYFSFLARAQIITLQNEYNPTTVGKSMYLLEDSTSSLRIQDVNSSKFQQSFKPSLKDVPTYDFIFSAIWSKFSYQNTADDSYFLQINNAGVDSIAVFVVDTQGNLLMEKQIIATAPITAFELPSATYLVELPPNQDIKNVYVRLKCDETLILDLKIGTLKSFYQENIWKVWFNAIYFGIVLIMVLYNTFLYFSICDLAYLYLL